MLPIAFLHSAVATAAIFLVDGAVRGPVGAAIGASALPHTTPNVVLGVSAAACAVVGLLALANRDLIRAI